MHDKNGPFRLSPISTVTYLFNTCHISILDDVARELRGVRKKLYLEGDTT
jgi:hypothetical protein